MKRHAGVAGALLAAALFLGCAPIRAMAQDASSGARVASYADLADLADSAPLVLRLQIRGVAVVEPERARDVSPGHARLYVEAQLLGVIAGPPPEATMVHYLVDVPLDARGKPPALKKAVVLVFARPVSGAPDELQLVSPGAELLWDPAQEDRVRGVLTELAAANAPGRITAVRELSYVPGDLAGAGETQIFLTSASGQPASISVEHKPGAAVRWSVSFSEVVDATGLPPARDTLAWYRLACFLPEMPPAAANISDTDADKAQAATDYAIVMAELGPCTRTPQ